MARNEKIAVQLQSWMYYCEQCGDDHEGVDVCVSRNGTLVDSVGRENLLWDEFARDLAYVLRLRVRARLEFVGDDVILEVSYAPTRTLRLRVEDGYVGWTSDRADVVRKLCTFLGISDPTVTVERKEA